MILSLHTESTVLQACLLITALLPVENQALAGWLCAYIHSALCSLLHDIGKSIHLAIQIIDFISMVTGV